MFTLKIQYHVGHYTVGTEKAFNDYTLYVADVGQVQRSGPALATLDELLALRSDYGEILEEYISHGATLGDAFKPEGREPIPLMHPATLLIASVGKSYALRYFLVDKAWLLGLDGGTIERIAP